MTILLLGSGGREHALAWKIGKSTAQHRLFIAPGNTGTALHGENVALSVNDFEGIATFCQQEKVELVVVGPEEPLVKGIVDHFAQNPALQHIPVIGPTAAGAQLEGSKAFAKHFMQAYGIPTAAYAAFDIDTIEAGRAYLRTHTLPIVLKADGLAAGKGVVICQTTEEALQVFDDMLVGQQFGAASARVVVEAFLTGIELSVFVLTDGKNYVLLPEAKDYKRIGVGDTGLNTGGMGAVSPVPFADKGFMQLVEDRVIRPTVEGLAKEGIEYRGFIFFGLIKVGNEPFVIEYNCRMGDPETEVVMPRLKNDLVELLLATAQQQLNTITIQTDTRAVTTVVAVSGGYPGGFEKGKPISGLETHMDEVIVFHAGTLAAGDAILSNGGRVLAVSAYGNTIPEAVALSKKRLEGIAFEGMYFREDIGWEFG
jgi:phosphoribosylamine---glycine ligase